MVSPVLPGCMVCEGDQRCSMEPVRCMGVGDWAPRRVGSRSDDIVSGRQAGSVRPCVPGVVLGPPCGVLPPVGTPSVPKGQLLADRCLSDGGACP